MQERIDARKYKRSKQRAVDAAEAREADELHRARKRIRITEHTVRMN
jgi:hypothetical protein